MHIKRLVISGFKSYKNEVKVDDFDKGFNVIIGRNGSGKSNLFSAIQLALTEDFNKLGPAARTALLHMGLPKHDAAYVEIIFDNTERILPFDEDEVYFKRYIGGKKDRYIINGQNVTEFKPFLEIAGFVNPYYFVKQGSVTEIATSSDVTRLNILKNITGSTVWEENLKRTIKYMENTLIQLGRTQEIIENINKIEKDLKEEENSLNEVLELEKYKRAYEFIMYEREKIIILQVLSDVEIQRNDIIEKIQPLQHQLIKNSNELVSSKESTQNIKHKIKNLIQQKNHILSNITQGVEIQCKIINTLQDFKNERKDFQKECKELENKFKIFDEEKKNLENELDQLIPKYERCKKKEIKISEKFTHIKMISDQHKIMYGLIPRFESPSSKNKNLKIKIKETNVDIKNINKEYSESQIKFTQINEEIEMFEKDIQTMKDEFKINIEKRTELECSLIEIRQNMRELEMERNKVSNEERKIEQLVHIQREALDEFKIQLYKLAGKSKSSGWISIDIILKEMRIIGGKDDILSGYYGQLFENITCDPKYSLAVEVCAGEKLFYHIVQNNLIASNILKEFNRNKRQGEIYFLLLDKLYIPSLQEINENGAHTIRNKLKYNPNVKPAIDYVFGNKLVCRSLEDAVRASKNHKTVCVTVDGDKVSSFGPITGGYRDHTRSVLDIQRKRSDEEDKIAKCESNLEVIHTEFKNIDDEYQEKNKKKEKIDSKLASLMSYVDKKNMDIKLAMEKLRFKYNDKIQKERHLEQLSKSSCDLQNQLEKFKIELNTTGEDEKENDGTRLDRTSINILLEDRKQMVEVSTKSREVYQKRTNLESIKNKLESSIRTLNEKKIEIEISLESASQNLLDLKIDEIKNRIISVEENIRTDERQLIKLEELISNVNQEMEALKLNITECKTKEKLLQETIHQETSELNKFLVKQTSLNNRLTEFDSKFNEIGSYPTLVTKFEKLKTKSIYKKLRDINIRLKDIPSVNRMASEFLKEAALKIKEFETGILNLRNGYDEIQNLIGLMEEEKCSVVLKTCRAIQTSFREIFSELVPQGAAEMILTSNSSLEFNEQTVFDDEAGDVRIPELWKKNEFTGLALRVRFSGDFASTCHDIKHFSGGQKSIVALSLILALQKCDPVSLYLFDEVDQALDPQYRDAVAQKLKQMSTEAQFICTTFRREFLEYANQFYGVFFRNQASNVKIICREEADDFIEDSPETDIENVENVENIVQTGEDICNEIFGQDFIIPTAAGNKNINENTPPPSRKQKKRRFSSISNSPSPSPTYSRESHPKFSSEMSDNSDNSDNN